MEIAVCTGSVDGGRGLAFQGFPRHNKAINGGGLHCNGADCFVGSGHIECVTEYFSQQCIVIVALCPRKKHDHSFVGRGICVFN